MATAKIPMAQYGQGGKVEPVELIAVSIKGMEVFAATELEGKQAIGGAVQEFEVGIRSKVKRS